MLRFVDSFDFYATADLTKGRWTQLVPGAGGGSASPTIESVGRRSTSGVRLQATGSGDRQTYNMRLAVPTASGATCICGFAYNQQQTFSGTASNTEDTASTLFAVRLFGVTHVWFRINAAGTISALRGTTLLGTSTFTLNVGTTDYLEFKVTISNTVGVVQFRKNSVLDATLNLSGIDTNNGGATDTWDEIKIGSLCGGSGTTPNIDGRFDDFILMDGSGSFNNDFKGDRAITALLPNAVGNSNASTPSSGGADRYTMVDEAALNSDTDYNTFAAAADKDTYGFGNCPISGSPIEAVCVNLVARKADTGVATIAAVARISGTDYDFGVSIGVSSSYTIQQQIWERSAVDGTTAWTTAVIDAAEFGMKKTA